PYFARYHTDAVPGRLRSVRVAEHVKEPLMKALGHAGQKIWRREECPVNFPPVTPQLDVEKPRGDIERCFSLQNSPLMKRVDDFLKPVPGHRGICRFDEPRDSFCFLLIGPAVPESCEQCNMRQY